MEDKLAIRNACYPSCIPVVLLTTPFNLALPLSVRCSFGDAGDV